MKGEKHKMIGMTVRYDTVLGKPSNPGEEQLLSSYGGVEAMLRDLRGNGIESMELSMLSLKKTGAEGAARAAKLLTNCGIHLTVHGLLEGISGREHFDYFRDMYEIMMKKQGEILLTVHSLATRDETASCLESFAAEAARRYPGTMRIALENQRIHRWDGSEHHLRISSLQASLPDMDNVGMCWDFGHYGYNQLMERLPLDGVPVSDVLKRVIHTHIHSLKDLDTHHPLTEQPAGTYIKALRSAGYSGVYNLELVTSRYYETEGARQGTEDSIRVLKHILNG